MAARGVAAARTHRAAIVAAAAAAAFAVVAVTHGTWAVGGSDSSCYALMADAFARGDVQPSTALAREAPWPNADLTFAPAGFIPSPVRTAAASPVCAPGFSLLLAPFRVAGGRDGIFLAMPLAGALLVWLTFVFGRQLASPGVGAGAAILVATMPVALFQVTQPMNDVTVTTLWLAVLVSASTPEPSRSWLLGAFTGLAILVRPNLAPAAAVVGAWLTTMLWHNRVGAGAIRRSITAFTVAAAPSALTLLALNTVLYGHPLQSGYGSARDLFSSDHAMANVRHYGTALFETQLGLPLFGIAAVWLRPPRATAVVWLTVLVAASMSAVYLLYRPFPEWWYLRFFLPAMVPMTVLALTAFMHLGRLMPAGRLVRRTLGVTAILAVTVFQAYVARNRQVMDLHRLEARFRRASAVVRERLPENALLVTVWHSGTMRYHAGRPTLLWDSLDPAAADDALSWLEARGYEPYLLLERWEEPVFRERFAGHSESGGLDWPPRVDLDRQVRIFRPADRRAYMAGEHIPTEWVLR